MPARSPHTASPPSSREEGAPARPAAGLGYVGLDVSQAEVVACLLLPNGREATRRWVVPNTQPGAEVLAQRRPGPGLWCGVVTRHWPHTRLHSPAGR